MKELARTAPCSPFRPRSNAAMGRLDSIDDLRVFDAIVRAGSLSGAALDLDVSLTLVSKRLKRLEGRLGVRLLQRTTRQLGLTEEGGEFLVRCRTALEAIRAAEDVAGDGASGVVRVTATAAFAQRQIAPRLPRFLARHPGISVQVLTSDDVLDLVERRIDVAMRQAPLVDSRLIARPLVPDARILCASPAYLARAGTPRDPLDLADHACLTVGDPRPTHWRLCRGGESVDVSIRSAVGGIDGEICHAAALADGGIAMKAAWDVGAGRLVRILPDWWGGRDRWVRLVYPARLHQARRVRAFIAFMEAEMTQALAACATLDLFEAPEPAKPSGRPRTARNRAEPTPTESGPG